MRKRRGQRQLLELLVLTLTIAEWDYDIMGAIWLWYTGEKKVLENGTILRMGGSLSLKCMLFTNRKFEYFRFQCQVTCLHFTRLEMGWNFWNFVWQTCIFGKGDRVKVVIFTVRYFLFSILLLSIVANAVVVFFCVTKRKQCGNYKLEKN